MPFLVWGGSLDKSRTLGNPGSSKGRSTAPRKGSAGRVFRRTWGGGGGGERRSLSVAAGFWCIGFLVFLGVLRLRLWALRGTGRKTRGSGSVSGLSGVLGRATGAFSEFWKFRSFSSVGFGEEPPNNPVQFRKVSFFLVGALFCPRLQAPAAAGTPSLRTQSPGPEMQKGTSTPSLLASVVLNLQRATFRQCRAGLARRERTKLQGCAPDSFCSDFGLGWRKQGFQG